MRINSIDLYQAKEKCLELQATNSRLVLKGNSPILLATTLLKDNPEDSKNFYNMLEISTLARNNSIDYSFLDALVICLNEKCGVNAIIDYLPVTDNPFTIINQLDVIRNYNDEETKRIILSNNIQVFLNLKIEDMVKDIVTIAEKISSYSYMGLTGISKELSKRFKESGISNCMMFGGSPSAYEFEEIGYKYTDDTIAYNNNLYIGKAKGQSLTKNEIWPRSIELSFGLEDDTNNLEIVSEVLIDYFAWIEKELKEKGPANAMSPMQPKTYKKN